MRDPIIMFLGNLILYVQQHMYLYIGFAWLTSLYCTQYLQYVGDKNSLDCYYVHMLSITNFPQDIMKAVVQHLHIYVCVWDWEKKEKSACDLFTPTLTNSLKIALHIASSMVTAELHLDFHKIVYSTKVPTIDFARTKLRKIYAFPSAMP